MIYRRPDSWLLAPPPSLVSKLSLFLSLPVCRRSSLLTGDGGVGKGVGEEPNHTTARSLVLLKSFSSLVEGLDKQVHLTTNVHYKYCSRSI
jgi:hypothetical protein